MTKYISLEGIIGAGKSTTLKLIVEELERRGKTCKVVDENVEHWVSIGLLQAFYNDKSRNGYLFQTKAFHDRVRECQKVYNENHGKADYVFMERTVYTDSIFMEELYDSGTINDLEWKCYKDWWSLWTELIPFNIDLVLYLCPPVNVAMDRIRQRARPGEEGITREYQDCLDSGHKKRFASDGEMQFFTEFPKAQLYEWDSSNDVFSDEVVGGLVRNILRLL